MAWVIKMTGDDGVFYGSSPDHEGLRYRLDSKEHAEKFDTQEAAEAVFYWFHQIRDLKKYSLEAVLL